MECKEDSLNPNLLNPIQVVRKKYTTTTSTVTASYVSSQHDALCGSDIQPTNTKKETKAE